MRIPSLATLVLGGCLAAAPAAWAQSTEPPGGAPSSPIEPGRSPVDAVKDRSGQTLTPMDQGISHEDLQITQSIRQALIADGDLSIEAKNVKVITSEGVVALRGEVASESERARIESIARGMPDVQRVDSQLEVADSGRP